MIRFALLGCLILALCGAAPAQDKKDPPKDPPKELPKDPPADPPKLPEEMKPFQGTWTVEMAMAPGKPAPKEKLELEFKFDGKSLTVSDKGKAEKGSYDVNPKKTPAEIDLMTPRGDKVAGIYKFDNEFKQLTLCFIKSKDAARPKGFDDKEAVTLILEKAKK